MINGLTRLCAGVFLALFTTLATAEEVTLSVGEMRQAASLSLGAGNFAQARALADALLRRDPTDEVARIILIEALSAQGRHGEAVEVAALLFQTATSDNTHYIAARFAAREHAALEHGTRAQFWLRRAGNYSPNAQATAEIAEDFRFVRARNPLSVELQFGFAPTSNVNNGSSQTTQTVLLFGVPFELILSGDARALSGVSISSGVNLSYTLSQTQSARTVFTSSMNGTTYVLSRAAEAQAPDVTGEDFSSVSARVGLRRDIAFPSNRSRLSFGIDAGRTWAGLEPFYDSLSLSGQYSIATAAGSTVTLQIRTERQDILSDGSQRENGQLGLSKLIQLANGDQLTLSARLLRGWAADRNFDYTGYSLGADYAFARPIAKGRLAVSLDAGQRFYERATAVLDARQDTVIAASATFTMTNVEYFGFSPQLSLTRQVNQSNSERYDTRTLDAGLEFISAF